MFVKDGDNYADRASFGNLSESYRGGGGGQNADYIRFISVSHMLYQL